MLCSLTVNSLLSTRTVCGRESEAVELFLFCTDGGWAQRRANHLRGRTGGQREFAALETLAAKCSILEWDLLLCGTGLVARYALRVEFTLYRQGREYVRTHTVQGAMASPDMSCIAHTRHWHRVLSRPSRPPSSPEPWWPPGFRAGVCRKASGRLTLAMWL